MKKVLPSLAGTLLLATAATGSLSVATPALAAESYDSCTGFIDALPATITTQGTWCLRKDLSTAISNGLAISVKADDVTIDCNNFKLGGLAAGDGTTTLGIYAENRHNTTIRNCNVRGFLHGIHLIKGGGHLVENNTLEGNTHGGVMVDMSADSTIRGNRVSTTGGSTSFFGGTFGIYASGADVIDNTVNDVAPPDISESHGYGIHTNANGEYSVIGNRIRGVRATGNGEATGISNANSGRVIVRDNDVQGSGLANSMFGVKCSTPLGTARDNVIAGFVLAPVRQCMSYDNAVNENF